MSTQTQTARIKPLRWPKYWRDPTNLQKSLLGVPVIGIQDKTFRELCEQLAARDESRGDEWESEEDARLAERVTAILARHLGWPSDRFIPRDPFEIVCWDRRAYPNNDLVQLEALLEIEREIGVGFPDDFWSWSFAQIYGDVIEGIRKIIADDRGEQTKNGSNES